MIKKILWVFSNQDDSEEASLETIFDIEEFITSYYSLHDKGFSVTIASPKGGELAFAAQSFYPVNISATMERLKNDADTKFKLTHSLQIENLKETDFDALFYPGGHETLRDLATDKSSIHLIEAFYRNNKPIAFVGQACAALQFAKNTLGEPLVKGKKVTGFSNEEQRNIGTKTVPFSVEDMLIENGAVYSKLTSGQAYAIDEGNLITGQNAASALLVVKKLIELL